MQLLSTHAANRTGATRFRLTSDDASTAVPATVEP